MTRRRDELQLLSPLARKKLGLKPLVPAQNSKRTSFETTLTKQQLREWERKSRTLEATFSSKLRTAMRRLGVLSRKVNDRVNRGIPDIYFSPGSWIESKVLGGIPTASNYPMKYFTRLQKEFLDVHGRLGDKTYAAVLWELGDQQSIFIFMPWWHFRRVKFWDLETSLHFGKIIDRTWQFDMERFFKEGKFEPSLWWENAWTSWPHSTNPNRFNTSVVAFRTLEQIMEDDEREEETDTE